MNKSGAINAKIDNKIHTQMKNYCFENGIKVKKFIELAIISHLEKVGRYGKKSAK